MDLNRALQHSLTDLQKFTKPKRKAPWKTIRYAATLFVLGSFFLTLGACLFSGVIETEHHDRWSSLIVIGSLMFIPGSYYCYLSYHAYRRTPGFSFDDIPEFD